MFYISIPNGSDQAIDSIADVTGNKKLTISFIGCRAATPQGQKIEIAIDGAGEAMPFIMFDQGVYSSFQHYVAAQQLVNV